MSTSSPKVCTHATPQTLFAGTSMCLETCVSVCLNVVYFMPCVMCSSLTLSFETLNMPQLFMSKSTQDKARHHRRWRSPYLCIFHQAQWRVEACALCFPLFLKFFTFVFFSPFPFFGLLLVLDWKCITFLLHVPPPHPSASRFSRSLLCVCVCVFLVSKNHSSIRRWEGEK